MKKFSLSFPVVAGLVLAAIALTSVPAAADHSQWCLRAAGESGGFPRCRYATFEQCQSAAAFSQGWCERNSRAASEDMLAKQRGNNGR
jgi:hypothetical protein